MKVRYEHQDYLDFYSADQYKMAKISGILQITQEAGNRQMTRDQIPYNELLASGKAFMLSRLDMEIHEPLKCDEMVTVSSWPCESQRATFLRNYSVERDGKRIITISSQWVLVDIESRKVLKVEDLDMSSCYFGEYIELCKDKLRVPRDVAMEEVGTKLVQYTDLDYNGHMNNTYYLDVLSNFIPELPAGTHRAKTVRLHYSKEAVLGETISIQMAKIGPEKYLFKTLKENGETNIICEIGLTAI